MPRETTQAGKGSGQLVRAVARSGPRITLMVDGGPVEAILGDSVLAAVLTGGHVLRHLEFGGEPRAGFCLMGACQDCWVWIGENQRARACTTPAADGMAVWTRAPDMGAHPG